MMRETRWFAGGILALALGCGTDESRLDATSAAVDTSAAEAPTVTDGGPELVGPGTISLPDRNETFPAEDPLTGDLWFSVYDDSFDDQRIMLAHRSGGSWSEAETASFSGVWGDRAPRFSPDGSALYFTSNRPRPGSALSEDMNVWRIPRVDGEWGEPELVPGAVNSAQADMHASLTNAAIWLASNREGTAGRSDIFRVAADGSVEHLSAPINDERSQPDVLVDPAEAWMILAITDHPDGLGGDDLFLSRFADGQWAPPVHLGAPLNSPAYEYGPTLSADGSYLYFTSHRRDDANVYRVPLAGLLGAGP